MHLISLYELFAQKYGKCSDEELRRKLLGHSVGKWNPVQKIILDKNLVIYHPIHGMELIKHTSVQGIASTTASTTMVMRANGHYSTLTKRYADLGKPLQHPDLPLLAVKDVDRTPSGPKFIHHALERVYVHQCEIFCVCDTQ